MTKTEQPDLASSAFGYIRVSGLTQLDGGGPERQREAIAAYALTQGIEIVRWFEESHTGTDLEGRPVFRKMRVELLSDGVSVVIVEKLDRLARSIMIQENILADFQKNGIDLRSATNGEENLCSDDPTRTFIRQVLGAVAQFDRSMLVSRMKAGKQRVLNSGKRCGGRIPYSEHSSAVELVNRIHFLRRNGYNVSKITEVLNAEGFRTLKGTAFHAAQISRVLRSARKTTEKPL